ncbi:MAG: PSD1 and planctomycete cytochrome C domain-containing protein [Fuerstiella sp.]
MNFSQMPLVIVVVLATRVAFGDDGAAGDVEFFEQRIRPVLIRHCYKCHSAASPDVKGDLRLDSRDLIRQGGKSGPAVVPGKTKKSLLLEAIRHESFEMPPDRKLSHKVIADFEKWIEIGAPDPRDRPPSAEEVSELSWRTVLDERRSWWSLQAVVATELPATQSGVEVKHAIDAFIAAKQRAAGITSGQPATPRVLARRLSLVLTGLPPASAEVEQFVEDSEADPDAAHEALVDRMLASKHFGEHWARHWMDVVRFAETHGYEWNHEIRDAWRYRDYLIRAFNNDVPYDQLVREHIAGDLLESPRLNERLGINESITGTAFWRFGELGHDNCVEFPEIRFDALDNQIDTFAKAFQGLTISCARCHDHKIDAISTKDYYALVGMLESCSQVVHTVDSPKRIADVIAETQELKKKLREQLGKQWLSAVDQSRDAIVSAISAGRDGDGSSSPLTEYLKDQKPGREDPGYVLRRFSRRNAEVDVASLWLDLKKEYTAEQTRRVKSNAENFEVWADFRASETSDWSASGLGLSNGPSRAGEFTLTHEGDQVVAAILPAGLYTNVTSDRLNGSLRSPWLPTQKKYISVQLVGDGRSMVRSVVDSCALNEFAGGGLEYLHGGVSKWKRFPTSAGGSHRSFVELTTRSDNPRWPDRPGRAGTNDPKDLRSPRSSFGVMQAVLHDSPSAPLAELSPILALFEQPQPSDAVGIATVFQTVARNAVIAWKNDLASDADVYWINWTLKAGILPNSSQGNQQISDLMKRYRDVTSTIPEPRVIAGLADHGHGRGFPVLQGSDPLKPGAVVQPRYIEVLADASQSFGSRGSGRRELAEIIASSSNPLTARVMVNRVWHHLFGRGIVATPDNFGGMGEKPTHPELLDFLATGFVSDSWSIKRLIRRIVLTRTYGQSSLPNEQAVQLDPGNQLLHHYPARRLSAEAIRDTILAVSGRLDAKLFGPSIHPHRKEETDYRKLWIGPLDGDGRRSIYTKVTRMEGPQFLELFDFPNPTATRGRRDRTNVPAQALALLNDPFVIDQANFWARRLVAADHDSFEERVRSMFRRALGRMPREKEERHFATLIRQLAGETSSNDADLLKNTRVWQDAAHAVFNMKEVIYIR